MEAAVPGKWSIYLKHWRSELNTVSLGGSCHWAVLDVLLPKWWEHTLPASETAGVARSQSQKGRG